MEDDRLRKVLHAASGAGGFYNAEDAEEASDLGLVQIYNDGPRLTTKGRDELARLEGESGRR